MVAGRYKPITTEEILTVRFCQIGGIASKARVDWSNMLRFAQNLHIRFLIPCEISFAGIIDGKTTQKG
jgi:hypothetical protein